MTTNPSLGARLGLAALGLPLLVPTLPAAAFDRSTDTAHRALTTLIVRRIGRGSAAVYQRTEQTRRSGDFLITGNGYTKPGRDRFGQNARSRDFTYSVIVDRDGSRAHDLSVRFANGEVFADAGSYDSNGRPTGGNSGGSGPIDGRRPIILKPSQGAVDPDGTVTFEGRSESRTIVLTVTDVDRNRTVTTRRVSVSNGNWSTRMELAQGRYRARVTNEGRAEFDRSDPVDFSVQTRYSDDSRATFDRPADRSRNFNGNVRFSGDSEGRQVDLKIYRNDREVASRRLDVRNDRWDTTIRLDNGSYRATIRTVGGRDTQSVRFTVDRE